MNRQQIEAWLALEGWVPFSGKPIWESIRHNGYLYVDRQEYMYVFGEETVIVRWSRADEDWVSDSVKEHNGEYKATLTDEQLQLIYQEIIKHEKD